MIELADASEDLAGAVARLIKRRGRKTPSDSRRTRSLPSRVTKLIFLQNVR
jgi:hypothetical protein